MKKTSFAIAAAAVALALLLLSAFATTSTTAIALATDRVVLHSRTVVPRGWTRVDDQLAPSDAPIRFLIAMRERNLGQLEERFWAVSDPQSPLYQEFMTSREIDALVAPEPRAVHSVLNWLYAHGIDASSVEVLAAGGTIRVATTVKHASILLSAQFFTFVHDATGRTLNKVWGTYAVPAHIRSLIHMIDGVASFPAPTPLASTLRPTPAPSVVDAPAQGFPMAVPQFVTSFYNVPFPLKPLSNPSTSFGAVEFLDGFYSPNDTAQFMQEAAITFPPLASENTVGENDPTQPDIGDRDLEWMGSMNPTATPWGWFVPLDTWFYGWSVQFLNTTNVPQVIAITEGRYEFAQCDMTSECDTLGVSPAQYVELTNVQFQKIGLRGVSILTMSGDSGANGDTDINCSIQQFQPLFPASSPFVTTVGTTEVSNAVYNLTNAPPICTTLGYMCLSGGDEVASSYATSQLTSGGGFSNISAQPSYQSKAVATYFASGVVMPPVQYYNAKGRGFPDVSALGEGGYLAMQNGTWTAWGTGLATSIVAGIMSLLNAEAMKQSGKPLGFLNPLLYQLADTHPSAFRDITFGDNACTSGGCTASCKGFFAAPGWDAVSGLGTPNYGEMAKGIASVFAQRRRGVAAEVLTLLSA